MVNLKMTTKYGAMASAVFASIVVAGVYFVRERSRRKQETPKLMRSMSMAVLHGGNLALKRLLEYHEAREDKYAREELVCELKVQLSTKKHPDYKELQSIVVKLEMSGKEAEAITLLKKAIDEERSKKEWHEAYETEMLLVEMLIYKGEYQKALECNCLTHEELSDARRPLYKAIINIILSSKTAAQDEWKKFIELNQSFHCEPCSKKEKPQEAQLRNLITDYNKFEKVVNVLKDEIAEAQAKQRN